MRRQSSFNNRYAFIGREREQGLLREWRAETCAGRTRVVLVSGEPGIGKTRLAEEVATESREAGMGVFWGRCFEWEGAPAYWPWVEILRDYLEHNESDSLRDQLASDAPIISQILPEIRQLLPEIPEPPTMVPAQTRFQLFDSITRFLRRAAYRQPLVLFLDDLQWADPSALLLLEFISRELEDAPILLLGTFRDTEVQRDHPLASTLAALASVRSTQRLVLERLDRESVSEMVQQYASNQPSERLVDALYAWTEGNPFFVTEVSRLLAEQSQIGFPVGHNMIIPAIPDGVRDVIRRRLDRLSPLCNHALAVAAVCGRDFQLDLLDRVTDRASIDLLDALDEAIAAGVITESGRFGRYRFRHALIQEALYTDLPTSRRVRLHSQVGTVLEEIHSVDRTAVYGDLAWHFARAPVGENLVKAIDYASNAGFQAINQLAWETAIGHFQQAVDLLEAQPDWNPTQVCDVLLALGEAYSRAEVGREQKTSSGIHPNAQSSLWRTAAVARNAGLDEQFARAALGIAGVMVSSDHGGREGLRLLQEAVDHLSNEDSVLKVRLLARLASGWLQRMILSPTARDVPTEQQIQDWSDAAVDMARRLGDSATLGYALVLHPKMYLQTGPIEEIDECLRLVDEANELALRANDRELAALALEWRFAMHQQRGDIAEAGKRLAELAELSEQLNMPAFLWFVEQNRAAVALSEGHYSDAQVSIERVDRIWPESAINQMQKFTLRRELHRPIPDDLVGYFKSWHEASPSAPQPLVFWLSSLMESERVNEARAVLEGIDLRSFVQVTRTKEWIRPLTILAEVLATLADAERAVIIYDTLRPYTGQNISVAYHDMTGGAITYYLGLLATTMEWWDEAERYFVEALRTNQQWGRHPYAAYTRSAWAEMLLRRGRLEDRPRALELIQQARSAAERMGMTRLSRLLTPLEARSGQDSKDHPYDLTPREVDVLRLAAEGLANPEIAEQLFVSPRTVSTHLSSVYNKLGVSSRTAATRIAVERGIL